MSYLLDKKIQNRKYKKIAATILIVVVLFYFRVVVFHGLSSMTHFIFRPVVVLGNNIGSSFSSLGYFFHSKNTLYQENQNLKTQILESQADRANYSSVVDENIKMKEILGRKAENMKIVLAGILAKPNRSLYDTLVIDAGSNQGIKIGNTVFAIGNIPIGKVSEVYAKSANVILFSSPKENTEVTISGKDIAISAVGRGGGNFEIILPRDLVIDLGTEIDLPGINHYVLGTVATIVSDPRDSFQKAILVSHVNIQNLKFVEVEI
ncbi:MAG: rod shape-determining protein MreC [Candidatus Nomurabacteria bacterium]|nr:rod shape-determining protein MreC [Candidatus Nomurabacteria bacterium]